MAEPRSIRWTQSVGSRLANACALLLLPLVLACSQKRADIGAYDPIAFAVSRGKKVENLEASIPPQCYTKTEGEFNPCWVCHTSKHGENLTNDLALQFSYAFSEQGLTNHWSNLFEPWEARGAAYDDQDVLAYVRVDNYAPLKRELQKLPDYPGFRPDLDFAQGFDERGFSRDGSNWRAIRYKPFAGEFWPTNGATDDVFIRLPASFRQKGGKFDKEVYAANLAVLEASFASDPRLSIDSVQWPTEALNEQVLASDLDGDGTVEASSTRLKGIPKRYFGDASGTRVRRAYFPLDTEFLHSVRYLDPDARTLAAPRMKELRYSRKVRELDESVLAHVYTEEQEEKLSGRLPVYPGSPLVGLRSPFGWMLQGFIEDADGRLRLQTQEEHRACMGCHGPVGVTVDQTFAFARKLPGAAGWKLQDLNGIPDVPQLGHARGEVLTYLERNSAGDEFRANHELIERHISGGRLPAERMGRDAGSGAADLMQLLAPSRERAIALNRAYMALVAAQRFERGRNAPLQPAANVHRRLEEEQSTELATRGRVYADGQLRLQWPVGTEP